MLIGGLLGFILGAGTGTLPAAFAGGILGMSIGMLIHGYSWVRAHSGNHPVIEHHRILCTPHGTVAELELLGDTDTKRWLDVRRCSIEGEDAKVTCSKMCLRMARDNGIKPGEHCDCEG
jgi:hypothetical protein